MSGEPGSADLAPPERLHPLILVTGIGNSIRGMVGGYAMLGYLAATGKLTYALLGAGALLFSLMVGLFLYWRRFEYRVGADEIRIDSGIFSRTHRSIPFDRVQDVDITQGPLARLLGIARVKFETGGASAAGNEEGVLDAIALDRAEALRTHVRARRGAVRATAGEETEERAPIYAMDLRRLLTAGLFNFSLALFAGLLGLTQTMGDLVGFDPFERAFWERLFESSGWVGDYVATHRVVTALAGLVLLLAIGLLTGLVRTVARDFRFRLERSGSALRRRRGLLTITDVSIPLRRVQAALVLTGPVRDRFGWSELKLQSLAGDEADGGGGDHVVAPLADDGEVDRILAERDWALPRGPLEPVSSAYVWGTLAALVPFVLLAIVQASFIPLLGLAALVVIATVGATSWLAWRRTGFALDGEMLVIRRGWWRRATVLVPRASIQSIDLRENALTRRLGVATLTLGVAGGRGYSGHSIPAIPREKASQLRFALLSRFA